MAFRQWFQDTFGSSHASAARRRRAKDARRLYLNARRNAYKPNGKTEEVIGLISGSFTHITTDAVPGSLTQTIFDTVSRSDSAQILLTNSTGVTRTIIAAWIRGKPVTRLSGSEGYIHDKFVDYESIGKDGDIVFETGNNFVVTVDQVNKLADYYWKLNRTKKHLYSLSIVGFQSWYEPGEWYTLQIGGAGEAEYIDSTVACYDVRCSIGAGGAPYTNVSFIEVEESWKFDSNEVARMIASGGFQRRPSQNVVTVASQYYSGYADYYCDGTSDQTEINNAITYLSQAGGGTVHLSKGIYNTISAISMFDNISIEGEGPGSIINQSANSIPVIGAVGTPTTSLYDVSILNLNITRATSITNATNNPIMLTYTDNALIYNTMISNPQKRGISCDASNRSRVINNIIDGTDATSAVDCWGIALTNSATSLGNIIQGNIVQNIKSDLSAVGIYIVADANRFDGEIVNNHVNNIIGNASADTSYGIYIDTNNVKIQSNYVSGCKNTATTSKTCGISIIAGSTNVMVGNNYCYNNGADTGLANTNGQNFSDAGTDTQWAG